MIVHLTHYNSKGISLIVNGLTKINNLNSIISSTYETQNSSSTLGSVATENLYQQETHQLSRELNVCDSPQTNKTVCLSSH